MRHLLLLLWICFGTAFAYETDFDYIVVGTSPISMLEALYKYHLGNRVLIVEQAAECGGAWKSIDICGIMHADMGCHEYGSDKRLQSFLEEYIGCQVVLNTPRSAPQARSYGVCPSLGCYELVHNLQLLIEATEIVLLLNHKLERVFIDTEHNIARVKIENNYYTAAKLLVTHASEIVIENAPSGTSTAPYRTKYPHIYLLFEDPTPTRFTYTHTSGQGISRAMNVTQFVGLEGTGMQLVAVQVYNESYLNNAESIFQHFKNAKLIDDAARLLSVENYTYEQSYFNMSAAQQMGAASIFEVVNTGHIANIGSFSEKWKKVFKPFHEALGY